MQYSGHIYVKNTGYHAFLFPLFPPLHPGPPANFRFGCYLGQRDGRRHKPEKQERQLRALEHSSSSNYILWSIFVDSLKPL